MANIGIVDDEVIVALVDPECADSITRKIATAAFEEYQRAGLKLHLSPNKTAAMITWIGAGSTKAEADLQSVIDEFGGLPFPVRNHECILPVTDTYRHIGCETRADGKLCYDVTQKAARIRTTTKQLKAVVLMNPAIPQKTRLQVVHTHVTTTGEHGAGCWCCLTQPEITKFSRAITDAYRAVDGSERKPKEVAKKIRRDVEVYRDLEVMMPSLRLVCARIRMFKMILERSSTTLLTLLFEGRFFFFLYRSGRLNRARAN